MAEGPLLGEILKEWADSMRKAIREAVEESKNEPTTPDTVLARRLAEVTAERDEMRVTIDELRRANTTASKSLAEMMRGRQAAIERIKELSDERDRWMAESEELVRQRDHTWARKEHLENELGKLGEELRQQKKLTEDWQAEAIKQSRLKRDAERGTLHDMHAGDWVPRKDMEEAYEASTGRLREQAEVFAKLRTEMERRLGNQRSTIESLRQDLSQAQARLHDLLTGVDVNRENGRQLEKRIENQKGTIQALRNQLNDVSDATEELRSLRQLASNLKHATEVYDRETRRRG